MNVGVLSRDRVTTHPRLRERREAVERDQSRKRRRRFVAAALVTAVGISAVAITRSPLFDVDHIIVVGAVRTGPEVVRTAAGIEAGEPMTSVDPAAVTRAVGELPWVDDVDVSRDWPGTVRIQVTERTAVAQADEMLVDGDGRVLGPVEGGDLMPEVRTGDHDAMATMDAMPDALRSEVRTASSDPDGEVTLELRDGITVLLGGQDGLRAKFAAIDGLLSQADRSTIATIDVTVPTAATLTRRGGGGS